MLVSEDTSTSFHKKLSLLHKVPGDSYEENYREISTYRRDTTVIPTLNQRTYTEYKLEFFFFFFLILRLRFTGMLQSCVCFFFFFFQLSPEIVKTFE